MKALIASLLPVFLVAGCLSGDFNGQDQGVTVPKDMTLPVFDIAGLDLSGAYNCTALNMCVQAATTPARSTGADARSSGSLVKSGGSLARSGGAPAASNDPRSPSKPSPPPPQLAASSATSVTRTLLIRGAGVGLVEALMALVRVLCR